MNDIYGNSLKRRLMLYLCTPLFFVLILGAVITFKVAQHVSSVIYDRWLYDSAMTLAQQIKIRDGQATMDLSPTAVAMFEWDSVDHIFGKVTSRRSGLLFSNADFPPAPNDLAIGRPQFYDSRINGKPARIAAIRMFGTESDLDIDILVIQVAETMHKRNSLVADILYLTVSLQIIVIALAGTLVWIAVVSSLNTLDTITKEITEYDADSLQPVAEIEKAPDEIQPLLGSINQLIEKITESQNTQRRFISNAAHQLRTPLAALQVQAEYALREEGKEKLNEALSHVLNAIKRSRHLVHQLLTLAHSDQSGGSLLEMVDIDLAELSREVLERWADSAIKCGIDLGYEGPEQGIHVTGEPYLLTEMIGNLIDNAIRYGHEGGYVTLQLFESPVVLTVIDDGPGIPEEERVLVFERFYRCAGVSGDGCGLGLPIAKEIAARHKALITIEDTPKRKGIKIKIAFSA